MSAPLFLVDELPPSDVVTLDGAEGHHAATVARLSPGEPLLVSDGRGTLAAAVVARAGRGWLEARVLSRKYVEPAAPRLVVVQAIAKRERSELAVQAMTEVGVDEIIPWAAARSVARWPEDRTDRARQRWIDAAREASKQSRRAWLPAVGTLHSTSQVCARLRAATAALVLHEEATEPLAGVPIPRAGSPDSQQVGAEVVIAVGPEGGIAPEEISLFAQAGARVVRLGANVLRTSTAGVAALAVLSARLGRW